MGRLMCPAKEMVESLHTQVQAMPFAASFSMLGKRYRGVQGWIWKEYDLQIK